MDADDVDADAEPRPSATDELRRRWDRFQSSPRWFETIDGRPRFRLGLERGTLLFASLVFLSGLIATFATVLAIFRPVAFLVYALWLVALASFLVALARRRIWIEGDGWDLAALVVALLAAVSAGAFHHHYFASQSDIGFYFTDAVATATTGSRVLHGAYDGLLPGYSATPDGARLSGWFGYSSLMALVVLPFGPFAAPWVNAPLAFITVAALYLVGRKLGAQLGAVLAIAFYVSSLISIWLARWTMTENGATATLWVSILLMLSLAKSWDPPRALALALALAYGGLVRIEGLLVLAWFVVILAAIHRATILAGLRRSFSGRRNIVATGTVVAVLALATFLIARALPYDYVRSGLRVAAQLARGRPAADAFDVPTTGVGPNWGDYALRYEWDSAVAYLLPWFALVAIVGIAFRLVPRRRALLVALLCVPYAIFIMIPPVTTAHPWFMRRLWVAVIPLVYLLAGCTLDVRRVAWRWPVRIKGASVSRVSTGAAAAILIVILLAVHVPIASPMILKREQDSVELVIPQIQDRIRPGAAVIFDEQVAQYASVLRFQHDGPVVTWFIQRDRSLFASIQAADDANGTFVVRIPVANKNFLTSDRNGFRSAEILNSTFENPPRKDFRTYLASPPLEQGYAPMQAYLDSDVPPNHWRVAPFQYQLVELIEPVVLVKNLEFKPGDWARTTDGLVALQTHSELTINLTRYRSEVLSTYHLGVHFVYAQTGGDKTVTANATQIPVGTLRSDESGTLRNASIPLPTPLDYTAVYLPQGTILRGALFDLY